MAWSKHALARYRHSSSPALTQDPTTATVLLRDLSPWVICMSDLGRSRTWRRR